MIEIGPLVLLRPWWLLALPTLPLLAFALRGQAGGRSGWEGRIPARLQPLLLRATDQPGRQTPRPWLLLCCTLIILALSGPAWDRQPLPLARSSDARVAVFDLSPSMGAADLKPDRLTRARFKLIDWLARREDGQTGLVVFGGQAFAVAPLTDDARTLRHLAEVLDPGLMPVSGARADLGLRKALELLEGAGVEGGEILLITDGINRRAEAMLPMLRERGVRLSVLAVGTAEGAPVAQPGGGFLTDRNGAIVLPRLDTARLADLARRGGGRFAQLSADSSDLDRLEDIDSARASREDERNLAAQERSSDYWQDRGPWLLLLALPFAALLFRRGWLLVGVLALGLHPVEPVYADEPDADSASEIPAAAGWSWRDLWLRRDQQAARALAAEDPERAEALAPTPDWRGAAASSAGDYERAAGHYSQLDDADGAYNQGTALAEAGRFEDAIEALKQALQRDPEHADAQANLKAIEDWLAQQPPQSDEQQGDGEQGEDGEEGEQGEQDQQSQGEQGEQDQQQGQQGEQDQQQGDQSESSGEEQQGEPDSSGESDEQDSGADEQDPQQEQPGQQDQSGETAEDAEEREQTQPQAGEESADGEQATRQLAGEIGPEEAAAERQQALEQWLRRVPDDPGGLLRRKFQLESRRQQSDRSTEEDSEW
jgi:Ca-activated chloride channel family protein